GIFTGITGGATLAGALRVCEFAEQGAVVLCMLPDTGERYLSTPLFAGVPADMTEEEWEISRSTPYARFDVCSTSPPSPPGASPAAALLVQADAPAQQFFEDAITDRREPVVMFAFEWCEFCWAVRKLFAAYRIPYRSVDLDSMEYQQDNRGGKIRAALAARTG